MPCARQPLHNSHHSTTTVDHVGHVAAYTESPLFYQCCTATLIGTAVTSRLDVHTVFMATTRSVADGLRQLEGPSPGDYDPSTFFIQRWLVPSENRKCSFGPSGLGDVATKCFAFMLFSTRFI